MMRHDDPAVLEALDRAWDGESGVLGVLRAGKFLEFKGEEFVDLLNSISTDDGDRLHPDFVRLIWFAPVFIEWQLERVVEKGGDGQKVESFSNIVRERVMEILGTP